MPLNGHNWIVSFYLSVYLFMCETIMGIQKILRKIQLQYQIWCQDLILFRLIWPQVKTLFSIMIVIVTIE